MGVHLSREQLDKFSVYYTEIIEWNRRFNLTSIIEYDEMQIKHFCDSLSVVFALNPIDDRGIRMIDIGSGAGFPGIPLKIALPGVELTLLEATAKKAGFLQHVKEKLGLRGIEIITGRAEEAAHNRQHREKFDVVLSRAVAPLPALAELCLPFCAVGGLFIAQKKGDITGEIKQASRAIRLMGGILREVKKVDLNEFLGERLLLIIEKLAATPENYPRRPGAPSKNPIV